MLDVRMLEADDFSLSAGPPRLALVHHGFRTTQLGIKDGRRLRFAPRFASLGLLNLVRSLELDFQKNRLPYQPEVKYFDEDCFKDDDELITSINEWLGSAPARFVLAGIYSLAVERTSALLTKLDPTKVCIVVGGAHPTVAPNIDYAHIVVRGEGAGALRHLLTKLFDESFGKGLDARGLCFTKDQKAHIGRPAFDRSLATVTPPAFPYELSQSRSDPSERPRVRWWMTAGKSPQIYICTQSCRARCTFCSTYLIHGRSVSRPVQYVKGDLDYIVTEFGHDSIEFHDDDLLQHEEFDDLMDLLAGTPITWTCNARSEFITQARAEQMAAAGCKRVFLGIESLSQRTLDYYHKATTVEMNETATQILSTAGIGVIAGFIFGAPHDSLRDCLMDLDRLLALPVFFLSASILTPDIGTLEYHRAKRTLPDVAQLGDSGSQMNIRPRPDLFGEEPPYGMPTASMYLSKRELNEVYELACCSFFMRRDTIKRISLFTMKERAKDVHEWYSWIEERADRLFRTAELPAVKERITAVRDSWSPNPSLELAANSHS